MSSAPLSLTSVLLLAVVALPAQDPATPRRSTPVGRIGDGEAPRIDGRLGDPCWQDAPAIGELTMVEPWLGRAPTQRTIVKLLHDREALYIGLWCFDTDPSRIRASQRERDARLDPDDRVEILLDPFENRRTVYFFQIGAGGSIGDILISGNGSRFDKPWDAIWSGDARVTDEGWTAEIAIPFRSIPRREHASSWGFNLRRYVRAANEEYQWAGAANAESFYGGSECGTITGLGELARGIGLDVVPYVAASVARDRRSGDADWRFDPDAGGEMYYRLSPSMTLATTVFTDFAETEVDSRQINLDRFPLFFPEKRDFFLEGLSYFTFGAEDAGNSQFLPFFTRRIGLADDGSKIPLLWGVKLTGEAGPFEVGLLDVETDATGTLDRENLAVARCKYALDDRTTLGLLGTRGDPTSAGENAVIGADFSHRETDVIGDLDLTAVIDVVASTGNTGADDGESFGLDLRANGREWELAAGTRWVAEDFRPALGFVSRTDTRQTAVGAACNPRTAEGGSLRRCLLEVQVERAESWEGEPQRVTWSIEQLGVELHTGDRIALFAQREFERVEADFTLFRDSATVAAGDYWSTTGGVYFETSEGRDWNGTLSLSTGDFFGGSGDSLATTVDWRTSPLLHLGGSYDTTQVDLGPGGAFTTHIAAARLDLLFTTALSLRNLVQFDNESNVLGWQSRLRWIYSPGCDLFLVVGTAWQRELDGSVAPAEQAVELKIAHTLRF